MRDADVGQPRAGGEHVVEVHHRLAHAHEDEVVDRLDAAEVQRLVEDLRRRSGCGRSSSRRSRRTCRSAGSPTARRRRASGGRRGSASARPRPARPSAVWKSALTVPSRGVRLAHQRQRRERHLARPAARAARPAGRSSRRSEPAPRAAHAHTWRARKAGSPASASVASSRSRSTASYGGSAMRLAKYLAHAGVASRRAAEEIIAAGRVTRRRRRSSPTRRATSTARSGVDVDGRAGRASRGARRSTRVNKPAGVVSTASDTARPPDGRRRSCPSRAAPVPGRPARRRHAPA